MSLFTNILYVAEPSADQKSALARAVSLADNNQAALTFMDVVPAIAGGIGLPPGGPVSGDLQSLLVEERRGAMESLIAPHGRDAAIRVEVGTNFLEVVRAVLRDGYDLVIKPAEDPDWLERLFGSNDMHLLRKCPCPIWLMKPGEKANYASIVAAVDFDLSVPASVGEGMNREILELASSLALSDFASLHLVHAWDAPAETLLRRWSGDPEGVRREYVETERMRHQAALDSLQNRLRERIDEKAWEYLSPKTHLVYGPAKRTIPETAARLEADLLVMGTVARTGMPGFIIGNTAESVLAQLKCAVLAVKPPGFKTPVTLDR